MTVEEIAEALNRPVRTVKRWVAEWRANGWPRVVREHRAGEPRWRYYVDRASFDAYCRGELPDEKLAA